MDGLAIIHVRAGSAPEVIARLRVDGVDSNLWTGEICRTGSGRYIAAAFAPVEALDDAAVRDRGAFGAVIDLESRDVRYVGERVALKHNALGCGPTNEITFVRHLGAEGATTELLGVGTDGSILRRAEVPARVADPAPVSDTTFVSSGASVYELSSETGAVSRSFTVEGIAFDLEARSDGELDLLVADQAEQRSRAVRARAARIEIVADAPLGSLDWVEGRNGRHRLVAPPDAQISGDVERIDAVMPPAAVSLDGSTVVEDVQLPDEDEEAGLVVTRPSGASARSSVPLLESGAEVATGNHQLTVAANVTTPVCAIPRNDPSIQVMQPSTEQVEWAVNQAVRGQLNVLRPSNWNNNGLGSYQPQNALPPIPLAGGGRIPAQVVLGVLAQEANLQQAAKGALPGVAANPKIADYYGVVYDSAGKIVGMDFDEADCGYGIAQITTGMTLADTVPYSANQKKMIATDYAANIAAAVRVLADKWNAARSQNLLVGDGDPAKVENWYFAIWAYNCCIYAPSGSEPYGVGWTNNPANSDWKPDRQPFLRLTYDDAATPYYWPYQEKVLGFAENGFFQGGDPTFETTGPLNLPATRFQFCSMSVNQCSSTHEPGKPAGYEWSPDETVDDLWYCTRSDRRCWWHGVTDWGVTQGLEVPQHVGEPEPTVTNPHPPSCSAASSQIPEGQAVPNMLDGAVVVDDLPETRNIVGCPQVASPGTFTLSFGAAAGGARLSEIDFHQIGAGYGGHFWYAHTNDPARASHSVTGTWTSPATTTGWTRVLAHIPDHGADTYQAKYRIWNGTKWYTRTVNQRWNANTWIDLGIFQLGAGSTVELSNDTVKDYTLGREIDIAWDAMAFVPSAKPKVAMVAFGDSYSAGEGVEPYYTDSDVGKNTAGYVNKCHRSPQAYPVLAYQALRAEAGTNNTSTFHFAACSGAVIDSLNDDEYSHGEVPQLAQGWLDENTTHVTIGISGNDARFSDIIRGCIATLTSCLDPNYHLTTDIGVDPEPLIEYEPQVIDAQFSPLVELLQDVKAQAPNAKIALVAYPHVVHNLPTGGGIDCGLLQEEVAWFDEMANRLDLIIAYAAASENVYFVDPRARFEGHEACAPSDEWINATVAWSSSGSGFQAPGAGSFHPKGSGHLQLAEEVMEVLPSPK